MTSPAEPRPPPTPPSMAGSARAAQGRPAKCWQLTFNQGFQDVLPRLAISTNGPTVAGCWFTHPSSGPRSHRTLRHRPALASAGAGTRALRPVGLAADYDDAGRDGFRPSTAHCRRRARWTSASATRCHGPTRGRRHPFATEAITGAGAGARSDRRLRGDEARERCQMRSSATALRGRQDRPVDGEHRSRAASARGSAGGQPAFADRLADGVEQLVGALDAPEPSGNH